jgi:hypothetical protein
VHRTPTLDYPAGMLVIVRRGESGRFRALETTFHEDPKVTICWDRRQAARRHERTRLRGTPDRRRLQDRRGPPPVTWSALDFLVTTGEAPR